jgi:hypothetical protein
MILILSSFRNETERRTKCQHSCSSREHGHVADEQITFPFHLDFWMGGCCFLLWLLFEQ